jgi:hypothetical protein
MINLIFINKIFSEKRLKFYKVLGIYIVYFGCELRTNFILYGISKFNTVLTNYFQ